MGVVEHISLIFLQVVMRRLWCSRTVMQREGPGNFIAKVGKYSVVHSPLVACFSR